MKLLIALLFISLNAQAKITLNKVDFKKTKDQGIITVSFEGRMVGIPELQVLGEAIQVVIPDSKVKKSIEKSVSFSSNLKDTQIRAYQTTQNETKVKALLPFNVAKKKDFVSMKLDDKNFQLIFPRVMKKMSKAPQYGSIVKKKAKKVKKSFLNEDYLNNLLKIEKKDQPTKVIKPTVVQAEAAKDELTTTQAAPQVRDANGNEISLLKYGGKFAAFLGVVLLLFYVVINIMKKGFIKKGKLGFLGNTDKIMVLNQHYIAPKKSLMLIKAHNQVFLVSNTDNGIHPISEIRDVAGLIKDEEKTLAGHNFDTKLDFAEINPENDAKIKMKEDISESNKESSLSSYAQVKDRIKFSDQIKQKVKGLKSLQ